MPSPYKEVPLGALFALLICAYFLKSSLVLMWVSFVFTKKEIRSECTFQNLSFTVLYTFS